MIKIAVTGHRPNKLWGYNYNDYHYYKLKDIFKNYIINAINNEEDKSAEIITGMAIGVDTIFAIAAIELKNDGYNIKLVCAIPFKGQESKWPIESQKLYNNILNKADEVIIVSHGNYAAWKMQKRNEYMIDRLSNDNDFLIAVWDGSSGGTANCIKYAKNMNKNIIHIDPYNIK